MAGGRSAVVTVWLLSYNVLNTLGWWFVLLTVVSGAIFGGGIQSFETTWDQLGGVVWNLQRLVLLDVIHAELGWWGKHDKGLFARLWCKVGHRSEMFITLFLVGDQMHKSTAFAPLLFSWALADIFRFPYYGCSVLGIRPTWLKNIRYSVSVVDSKLAVMMMVDAVVIVVAF
eukprot:m.178552 g.178552  ORF g.178552 m.178552 type:complete len:172 (+) comp31945_c2_seq5:271-786(+)